MAQYGWRSEGWKGGIRQILLSIGSKSSSSVIHAARFSHLRLPFSWALPFVWLLVEVPHSDSCRVARTCVIKEDLVEPDGGDGILVEDQTPLHCLKIRALIGCASRIIQSWKATIALGMWFQASGAESLYDMSCFV